MTKMTLEQVRDWHRVVASENAERRALCSPNGERWELWNDEFNKQVAMADAIDAHLAKGAQEWQPIETAPRDCGLVVVFWRDENGEQHEFDFREDGVWVRHADLYDDWLCVAKPEGSTGPKEDASYTHWMPLPAAPMLSQRGEVGS